jgi:glycine cleavage system H protein
MPFYTKEHEWITLDNGVATIGITDHAQRQLGDLIFIELPKVGEKLTTGALAGTVESGKAVSDVYSPVAGEVVEVNQAILDDPSLVNVDAMANWFFRVRMQGAPDESLFMDEAQYGEYAI